MVAHGWFDHGERGCWWQPGDGIRALAGLAQCLRVFDASQPALQLCDNAVPLMCAICSFHARIPPMIQCLQQGMLRCAESLAPPLSVYWTGGWPPASCCSCRVARRCASDPKEVVLNDEP